MQKQLHRIFKFGSGSVSSIHSSNKRKRWRKCCGALSCYWSPSAAVGVVKHTTQKQQASQANMQRLPIHAHTCMYEPLQLHVPSNHSCASVHSSTQPSPSASWPHNLPNFHLHTAAGSIIDCCLIKMSILPCAHTYIRVCMYINGCISVRLYEICS